MRARLLAAMNELEVVLAQQDATVFFTKTHIADLRSVLEAEKTSSPGDSADDGQS